MTRIAGQFEMLLAGEPVVLMGERAMFRPVRNQLVIADLHLGKGDALRQAGIPLPSGGTRDDLDRLSHLIRHHKVNSLLVLGDFLHGQVRRVAWFEDWLAWRTAHAAIFIEVVAGTHDRSLVPEQLGVDRFRGVHTDGPFIFLHTPPHVATTELKGGYVVCGHLHPVITVPGLPRRWPAFSIGVSQAVLPAFSLFTGGQLVDPSLENQVFACVRGQLVGVPQKTSLAE